MTDKPDPCCSELEEVVTSIVKSARRNNYSDEDLVDFLMDAIPHQSAPKHSPTLTMGFLRIKALALKEAAEALYEEWPGGTGHQGLAVQWAEEWLFARAAALAPDLADQMYPVEVCLLKNEHGPHHWWYTSSGGGHMLASYDPVRDHLERDVARWWCPGVTPERSE